MRRLFWTSAGYAAGLGSSVWVQRRVRRAADQYAPEHVRQAVVDRSRELSDRARRMVIDLREAVADGRIAMRDTESRLRDEFDTELHPHAGAARSISGNRAGYVGGRPRLN